MLGRSSHHAGVGINKTNRFGGGPHIGNTNRFGGGPHFGVGSHTYPGGLRGYGTSYHGYEKVDCRRCCLFLIVFMLHCFAVIIITLAIALPATLIPLTKGSANNLQGSQIVSFSNFYCELITLRGRAGTITLINETPPLTASSIVISASGDGPYRIGSIHLHPNSNISVSSESMSVPVWVVKGRSNFESWSQLGSPPSRIVSANGSTPFSYNTSEEDDYYIIYFVNSSSSDSIDVTIDVEQFQFSTVNLTSQPTCSIISPFFSILECTLSVPYNQYSRALISSSETWAWECSFARGWAYTVAVFVPFIFAVFVVIAFGVTIGVCYKMKKAKVAAAKSSGGDIEMSGKGSSSHNV